MVHVIAVTKMDIERTANWFVKDIWRFHDLLESIVSDRRSQFVSGFWTKAGHHTPPFNSLPPTDRQPNREDQPTLGRLPLSPHVRHWQEVQKLATYCGVCLQQLRTLDHWDVPYYHNYGFHPRDDLPENKDMEKLDAASNTYLASFINNHEDVARALQGDLCHHSLYNWTQSTRVCRKPDSYAQYSRPWRL